MAHPKRASNLHDDTIRSLARRLVANEGIDSLSLPRLAAVGGFTSAPLYRRFDTGADVASDLWDSELRDHFQRALRAALPWARDPDDAEAIWLSAEIVEPSEATRALVPLLIAARRLGPQGEEIRREVEAMVESFLAEVSTMPPSMVLAHIIPVLGAWFVEPVAAFTLPAVLETRTIFAAEYADVQYWKATSDDVPYTPPLPPRLETGDETLDDLRAAVFRVMGRYGVAGATSNRITREAGRSITSAYRRLGTKEDLVADAIGLALSTEFGFSGSDAANSMPFSRADRLLRTLHVTRNQIDERNRANRTFLLESMLAARYDPAISTPVVKWFTEAHQRFRTAAETLQPGASYDLVARWEFRIVSGFGAMLLSVVSPRLFDRNDPMPVLQANDTVCFGGLVASASTPTHTRSRR